MAGSIYSWSTTPASNGNADPSINFAEGQAPSTVNDSNRQAMGRIAEFLKDLGGSIAAGGTANVLTLTATSAFTALADGLIVTFRAIADNTGSATLNVNGLGAKAIRKILSTGEADPAAGDIKSGGIFVARYGASFNSAAGGWMLLNPVIDPAIFATLTGTQTITNKTLTSPILTGGTSSGMTLTGAALNGTLGATTPSTVVATTVAGTTGTFSGNITASQSFISSSSSAVLATTGAGTVWLQPNGIGSSSGAMSVASTGDLTIAGAATSSAGILIAAAGVPIATAALAFGAVGTYAFCKNNTGSIVGEGAIVAGSNLIPSDANNNTGGAALSGSWRAMGRMAANSSSLFLRIS